MSKLLTVITICYNSEKTINRCIDSVIGQLNNDIEYLIIDGKSKDNTNALIERYIGINSDIRLISEKDNGIYDAMNKGINLSTGKWIYFLNSDDVLKENVLEKVISVINTDKYDCIYGDVEEVLEYENEIYSRILKADKNLADIKKGMIFSHQSFFCKKESIFKFGLFNTKFRVAGDWNLILNLYLNGCKFYHMSEVIADFYIGGACSENHNIERHIVRKDNCLYKVYDKYYIRDMYYTFKSNIAKVILGDRVNSMRLRYYNLRD